MHSTFERIFTKMKNEKETDEWKRVGHSGRMKRIKEKREEIPQKGGIIHLRS